jgi:coenzyme F420 hydrogenase subunit beta
VSSVVECVVSHGWCSGCGVCVPSCRLGALSMGSDNSGQLVPECSFTQCTSCGACLRVCPFGPDGDCESSLAELLFTELDECGVLGRANATYALAVADAGWRTAAASGGAASWILSKALESGLVDDVVSVVPTRTGFPHEYGITHDSEALLSGSVYGQVSLDAVLSRIGVAGADDRFAVVCLPCQAKAIRLLEKSANRGRTRYPLVVGLTCGHQTTRAFAAFVASRSGATGRPVSFRDKAHARNAADFSLRIARGDGEDTRVPFSEWARFWNQGWFAVDACRWCEDVFAELADVTCMDAWLPEYFYDWRGTSLVVCRSDKVREMLESGLGEGVLLGGQIPLASVTASQRDLIRLKRSVLAQRLYLAERAGLPHPVRRQPAAPRARLLDAGEVWLRDAASERSKSCWRQSGERAESVETAMALLSSRLSAIQGLRGAFHRARHPGRALAALTRRLHEETRRA